MDNPTEANSQVLASDIGSNIIKATRRETVEFVSAGLKHHQGYSFGDGYIVVCWFKQLVSHRSGNERSPDFSARKWYIQGYVCFT